MSPTAGGLCFHTRVSSPQTGERSDTGRLPAMAAERVSSDVKKAADMAEPVWEGEHRPVSDPEVSIYCTSSSMLLMRKIACPTVPSCL